MVLVSKVRNQKQTSRKFRANIRARLFQVNHPWLNPLLEINNYPK